MLSHGHRALPISGPAALSILTVIVQGSRRAIRPARGVVVSPGNETIFRAREVRRKRSERSLSSLREGISIMIMLKLVALVVGAGVLVSLFSPEFDANFLLAIISCFS